MSPMCSVSVARVSLTTRRPHPVIVVEMLSPSSGNLDKITKLADYFRVGNLTHYLIIDLGRLLHYRRQPTQPSWSPS